MLTFVRMPYSSIYYNVCLYSLNIEVLRILDFLHTSLCGGAFSPMSGRMILQGYAQK